MTRYLTREQYDMYIFLVACIIKVKNADVVPAGVTAHENETWYIFDISNTLVVILKRSGMIQCKR